MREIESGQTRGIHEVASSGRLGKETGSLAKRTREAEAVRLEGERQNIKLRHLIACLLFSLLAVNTLGTLAVVYFVGFGLMVLSNTILLALIGETLAHVGAMFFTVTRYLFPTDKR